MSSDLGPRHKLMVYEYGTYQLQFLLLVSQVERYTMQDMLLWFESILIVRE